MDYWNGMSNVWSVTILVTMLLVKIRDCAGATIVSTPGHLYVLSGEIGVLRCQNRTTTPYTYVRDAVWYRRHVNGSDIPVDANSSESIYTYGYSLTFNPILVEHEGTYLCCTPATQICSNTAYVRISVPPMIRAVNSTITGRIGAQIFLQCSIIEQGIPQATIGWRKNGVELNNDRVITNDSVTTLRLTNLTMSDIAEYTCEAANEQLYVNDQIELQIETLAEDSYTETNVEVGFRVLATDIQVPCQVFEQYLQLDLASYILRNYGYNVMVMAKLIECRANSLKAVCDIKLNGSATDHTLQLLLADLSNTTQGIHLSIGILLLCDQDCLGVVPTDSDNGGGDDTRASPINMWIIILAIVIILFVIVIALICLVGLCTRCKHMRKKAAQHKIQTNCVVTTTLSNSNADAITPSTRGTAPLAGHYNTLQHKYCSNHDTIAPSYNTLTSYPGSDRNDHLQPKNVMRCTHGLRTDYNEQRNPVATADRPIIFSNTDGSGFMDTGRVQVVIPSSISQSYQVTPSNTHASYFDVH